MNSPLLRRLLAERGLQRPCLCEELRLQHRDGVASRPGDQSYMRQCMRPSRDERVGVQRCPFGVHGWIESRRIVSAFVPSGRGSQVGWMWRQFAARLMPTWRRSIGVWSVRSARRLADWLSTPYSPHACVCLHVGGSRTARQRSLLGAFVGARVVRVLSLGRCGRATLDWPSRWA